MSKNDTNAWLGNNDDDILTSLYPRQNEREREKKPLVQTASVQSYAKSRRKKRWREEKDGLVVYLPDLFHLTISLFTYQSKQKISRPSSLSYRKYSQEIQSMLLSTGGR